MTPPGDFGQREAALQQAKDLRALGRLPEALAVLAGMKAQYPGFSRWYHELGHCHALSGNAPAAIETLQEAVRINPTLPASWHMLEQLYRMQGDAVQAAASARNLAMLQNLPTEIVVANSLYADGDRALAEDVLRDYLDRDAANVGALRLLARICQERDSTDEAEVLLERALEFAPDYHDARLDYVMVLLHRQRYARAGQEAAALLTREPGNRAYLKQYAAACVGLGDYEPVIDIYGQLLTGAGESATEIAELRLWRGNALRIAGRLDEAIADYRAAIEARPGYGVAWFSLANLKTWRFGDEDIAAIERAQAADDLQDLDRIYLAFALGKAMEDRAAYARSWQHYAQGNALRHQTVRYRPEAAKAGAKRLEQTYTAALFADRSEWGHDDPAPIFIVGLPRSGSTLVEQIIASHSQVEGTQELTEIGHIVTGLCGQDPACALPLHPDAVAQVSRADISALGERFIDETRTYRRLGRPRFIDKMPNNVWHIGLIHLIVPNATIIDVRREPMACCFSNLKQLFGGANQEFAYGLEDIGRHYRAYLAMMEHWHATLPGRVLTVHYEDLVDDLDASARLILAHCRLAFEPACLRFHQTQRSVRTPSSEQVRQPIDRDGLGQWQHYAQWLAPLHDVLGDALIRYRT
ncbi:tetratricopeptide repeat-containing sulfotransferase family protein [Novosphingobium sp.]|uniref:tetratricopeptide repeat-containing sulfotransferase family protein n=1 Tax=Novosphingobium sp. TaxID=1874826 RepID=UPI003D134402